MYIDTDSEASKLISDDSQLISTKRLFITVNTVLKNLFPTLKKSVSTSIAEGAIMSFVDTNPSTKFLFSFSPGFAVAAGVELFADAANPPAVTAVFLVLFSKSFNKLILFSCRINFVFCSNHWRIKA